MFKRHVEDSFMGSVMDSELMPEDYQIQALVDAEERLLSDLAAG